MHRNSRAGDEIRRNHFRDSRKVSWEQVGFDRIGCAWLILRDIDPKARFVFVPRGAPLPQDTEAFDVPCVRFSYHGGHGSFQALLE